MRACSRRWGRSSDGADHPPDRIPRDLLLLDCLRLVHAEPDRAVAFPRAERKSRTRRRLRAAQPPATPWHQPARARLQRAAGDRHERAFPARLRLRPTRGRDRRRRVDRRHGGRPDALNAAINLARNDLVVMTDVDCLFEADALARIVEVFSIDPEHIVAVGGTVRVANGSLIEDGEVVEARVPLGGTPASQVAEYLRSFFGARIAWSALNGLIILSGAFGAYRRDLLRAVGGLSTNTLGEDMELTMRIHEQLRPTQPQARVALAPGAVCWTE